VRPISELIPHRGPMLLLDAVTVAGEDSIACTARVREDNPFLRCGVMRSAVCLEYMAQAAAAFAGFLAREPGPPRVGYLIGVNRLVLRAESVALGDELSVQAKRGWGDSSLGQFSCSVARHGAVIAYAKLSVYRPPPAAVDPALVRQE
jgi:predicted hotdog family 3-hydroxylacyl-ACP dehydratase